MPSEKQNIKQAIKTVRQYVGTAKNWDELAQALGEMLNATTRSIHLGSPIQMPDGSGQYFPARLQTFGLGEDTTLDIHEQFRGTGAHMATISFTLQTGVMDGVHTKAFENMIPEAIAQTVNDVANQLGGGEFEAKVVRDTRKGINNESEIFGPHNSA